LDKFLALEFWINKSTNYADIARHIEGKGLFRRNKLGTPVFVNSDDHKKKAIEVLTKLRRDSEKREFEDLSDEVEDRLREYWSLPCAGQYGLISSPDVDWRPNSRHVGYQMLQALLIKSDLLTKEQMKKLKDSPEGINLPTELYTGLDRLGVEASPNTIRRHVIAAAKTFYG